MSNVNSVNIVKRVQAVYSAVLPISLMVFSKLNLNPMYVLRFGICQIFHTSKIPKFFNSVQEKRVNLDIFDQKMRMADLFYVLPIY